MKRRLLKKVTAVVLSAGMVLCPIGGYIPDGGSVTVAYGDDLEYEGFKYKVVDDSYVEITGYTGSETEVVIPGEIDGYKVESIGEGSFRNNKKILKISIPNNVTTIKSVAFFGCSNLEEIVIPENVSSIGAAPFDSCNGLVRIIVDSNNTKFDSRNNCNAIIETETNTLLYGC